MIRLTRINRAELVVNADLIEHVEATPDTVVSMTTGQKFIVQDTPDQVVDRVIAFRQRILGVPVILTPPCELLQRDGAAHPIEEERAPVAG